MYALKILLFVCSLTIAIGCSNDRSSEMSWDELNAQVRSLLDHAYAKDSINTANVACAIDEAIALILKTIEAKERNPRPNQADLARMHKLLGTLKSSKGDYVGANNSHKRALEYAEKVYGTNHFEVADHLCSLAKLAVHEKRYDDAKLFFKQGLSMMGAAQEHAAYNPTVHIGAIDSYGTFLRGQGAYVKASTLYKVAFDVLDTMDHMPEEGEQLLRSGALDFMEGRMYTQALPFVERLLCLAEQGLARYEDEEWQHIAVANQLTDLAIIYTAHGEYSDAENLYDRAIEIYDKKAGYNSSPFFHSMLDILTERCRDHMEYMQRKRDGEELLNDDPPPYIYPRGATREYPRLEQEDHVEEEINAKEVLLDNNAGLGCFVSNYVSLVRAEDLESLYQLLHPKVRDDLSEEQKIAVMMFGVRSHLRNIDAFTVDCKEVSKAEMAEIEDRAIRRGSQYVVQPQVKVSITIERGPHSRVTIPVYASKYGDEWYLVQSVPGEERTKQIYEIHRDLLRKSQSQSETTD